MARVHGFLIVLLLTLGLVVPGAFAQSEMTLQTIKGDLLSIKGDRYVVKDFSGRLVYLQVDKKIRIRSASACWFRGKESRQM